MGDILSSINIFKVRNPKSVKILKIYSSLSSSNLHLPFFDWEKDGVKIKPWKVHFIETLTEFSHSLVGPTFLIGSLLQLKNGCG
jgi:hypothetical protein